MIRIALSNLRSASGRLVAAGIAIAVSVAFIVAALLFAQAFGDTMENQVRSSWSDADVAVMIEESVDASEPQEDADVLTEDLLADVTAVDGVADARLEESGFVLASAGATSLSAFVTGLPTTDEQPLEGALPHAADEVALTAPDAEALGAAVGDTITLEGVDSGTGEETVTVSGLLPDTTTMRLTLLMTPEGLEQAPAEIVPEALRIRAEDGADPAALADAIDTAVGDAPVDVLTAQEVVERQLTELSGASDMLTTVGLSFGLLSVGVASLVISNTFQVLVASRSRVLALCRAVGATTRQLRGATLLEGLVLGVVGSVAGVVLGLALAWGLSTVARAFWMPDFSPFSVTPVALLVGPLVGTVVTVVAGLVPAVRAGGASPVEALRPADLAAARARFPWVRTVVGALLAALGLGACLLAVSGHSVLLGILGCFALFVAVLVASRAFVPPLLGLLGRVLSRLTGGSTTVLLAGRSAGSAPRRSSSTTAALLIGVTLVSAVLIGAASLQRTIELVTAESSPVDLVVDGSGDAVDRALDDASIVEERTTVPATYAEVTVQEVAAGTSDADAAEAPGSLTADLTVVSADEAEAGVLRSDGYAVEPGTIRLAPNGLGGQAPTADYANREATVAVGGETFALAVDPTLDVPAGTVLVSGEDAQTIARTTGAQDASQVWVRLADDASIPQIEALVSQLSATGAEADAEPALLRAQYADTFQVAITVVLGLLAAAVVIAVIGVSNTLTLAVIDRRREGALLRALGFSRGAVGRMITVESLLMAVVALVLGLGLGTLFGWVGTASVITEAADPVLSVPAVPVALLAVAVLVAAVLASVLPARSMSRVALAQGLGE